MLSDPRMKAGAATDLKCHVAEFGRTGAACGCRLKSGAISYRFVRVTGEVMEKKRSAGGAIWLWRMVALAGWLCAGVGSAWFGCTAAWGEPAAKPDGSFLIPAYAYDRSVDIVTCTAATSSYVDAEPMVGNFRYPSQVEYDIEFPVSGEYALHIRYAALEARPLAVWLDDKELGPGCRTPTGGWTASRANWKRTCQLCFDQEP